MPSTTALWIAFAVLAIGNLVLVARVTQLTRTTKVERLRREASDRDADQARADRDQLNEKMQAAIDSHWQRANEKADTNIANSERRAASAEMRAMQAEAQIRHSEDSSRRHEFAAKAFEAAARGWHEYAKAVEALHTLETDERRT